MLILEYILILIGNVSMWKTFVEFIQWRWVCCSHCWKLLWREMEEDWQ